MTQESRLDRGPCEVEIFELGEADLQNAFIMCNKNPGHEDFVPVWKFTRDHLPDGFQKSCLVDLIKVLSDLTVRVTVRHSSEDRPHMYPDSDMPFPVFAQGNIQARTGTGWVWNVEKFSKMYDHRTCPCVECLISKDPKTKWAEIVIATAAHVVFDDKEGRHTTCDLFYDKGNSPDSCEGVLKLTGMSRVDTNVKEDKCKMTYITHDIDLADRLENLHNRFVDLQKQLSHKFNSFNNDSESNLPTSESSRTTRTGRSLTRRNITYERSLIKNKLPVRTLNIALYNSPSSSKRTGRSPSRRNTTDERSLVKNKSPEKTLTKHTKTNSSPSRSSRVSRSIIRRITNDRSPACCGNTDRSPACCGNADRSPACCVKSDKSPGCYVKSDISPASCVTSDKSPGCCVVPDKPLKAITYNRPVTNVFSSDKAYAKTTSGRSINDHIDENHSRQVTLSSNQVNTPKVDHNRSEQFQIDAQLSIKMCPKMYTKSNSHRDLSKIAKVGQIVTTVEESELNNVTKTALCSSNTISRRMQLLSISPNKLQPKYASSDRLLVRGAPKEIQATASCKELLPSMKISGKLVPRSGSMDRLWVKNIPSVKPQFRNVTADRSPLQNTTSKMSLPRYDIYSGSPFRDDMFGVLPSLNKAPRAQENGICHFWSSKDDISENSLSRNDISQKRLPVISQHLVNIYKNTSSINFTPEELPARHVSSSTIPLANKVFQSSLKRYGSSNALQTRNKMSSESHTRNRADDKQQKQTSNKLWGHSVTSHGGKSQNHSAISQNALANSTNVTTNSKNETINSKNVTANNQNVINNRNVTATNQNVTNDVDTDPTLTIIVSHPHGCNKQVSVGYYTKRVEVKDSRNLTKYVYNTATCPGSSGAPVYVLGRWRGWWPCDHPHSGNCSEDRQLNFSGVGLH